MTTDITRRSLFFRADAGPPIAVIGQACLVHAFVVCRSCGDACPKQAIRFRPRLAAPEFPEVTRSCDACGACVAACPASAVVLSSQAMS